ncbi:hypothetical protein HNR23_004917 [Nocardiopsis mwathae]|uniref:DUF397 domain-containing protein n=1 Tax=Nocardiopsis mwathae TaxID=1472723 RepID=A0A7X0D7Q2_9ACTN|nr:DUF397 domain-containing protein [Nocardiopsis mwathae]MBB6174857.1 hypothetical protein [Nocardiopsis mwathae]
MSKRDLTMASSPMPREWHTSTYTQERGACVEVAEGLFTGVRDSKNRDLGALFFAAPEWQAFVTVVKCDEL